MKYDFDKLPDLNWKDLKQANDLCKDILVDISKKDVLRALLENTEHTPELFSMCECHEFDDKIVLYNNLQKGYRIRLRLANDANYERAHNHRFSFSTYILHGTYYQRWYEVPGGILDEDTNPRDVRCVSIREEPAGSIFTIHHSTVHSTLTSENTFSLMICGPAEKDKACIIRMDTGEKYYKLGKQQEAAEVSSKVLMDRERFAFWKQKLTNFNII